MSDTPTPGGAGPALAAHSKDAATEPAPGQMASASATGNKAGAPTESSESAKSATAGVSDFASKVSGQAREAAGRAAELVSQMTGGATQHIARQGAGAVDQAMHFVREQPLVAVLTTGAICFALGILLGRR